LQTKNALEIFRLINDVAVEIHFVSMPKKRKSRSFGPRMVGR